MADTIRVLHIDDDPDLLDLAALFIERSDHSIRVETATDPTEALERLRVNGNAIDCVVSDYDMPDIDGLELLRTIAEERPDLPFILYTGKGSEEIASEAISLGVTDYMQKEVGTDQYEVLANRIRNAVERKRAEQDLQRREAVFQTLAHQDIVGIYIIKNGVLTYVNQKFADIFGYEPSDMIGTDAHTYAAPDDRDDVKEKIQTRLNGAVESHHYTFTGQRKDGSTFQVEVHGGRTTLDAEPATVGVLIDRE